MPANGKTILIAEDDPFISRMYEIKLRAAGYNVVLATNGRDAYEAVKTSTPSIIMTDLTMPELSGFEFLKALANDGFDFSACPAMVLTNSSNDNDRKAAQGIGVDYMVKADLTPRDVLERIRLKLGQPSSAS